MPKKPHFQNVGLAIYYPTPAIVATLKGIYAHLSTLDITLYLEKGTARHIPKHPHATHGIGALCKKVECLIVVGGDGSLLAGAVDAAHADIPLIGVNRGKLGFLSDIDPKKLSVLTDMLGGKYKQETRHLLELTINQGKEKRYALNDVVVSRKEALHLLEYDLFIDQVFVCHQRSDGMIISTPTGSTAYALSAGGPIITPNLNAIGLTPLCPHTLNSRPLVIPSTSHIDIHVLPKSKKHAQVHRDGRALEDEEPLEHLHVAQSDLKVTLMHPLSYNYFDTLKTKLHWEHKPYANLSEH